MAKGQATQADSSRDRSDVSSYSTIARHRQAMKQMTRGTMDVLQNIELVLVTAHRRTTRR